MNQPEAPVVSAGLEVVISKKVWGNRMALKLERNIWN
jgi:hypothetical protein